jgi:hypothetical protein
VVKIAWAICCAMPPDAEAASWFVNTTIATLSSGDEDDVVVAAADVDMASDQRLDIHLVVHEESEHLAKLLDVDIGGGQRGFVVVPACPAVVIVLREY